MSPEKKGLSEQEAKKLIEKYGYNELKEKRKTTWLNVLSRQLVNFMVWVLLAAAGISAFIGEMINFWVISFIIFFIIILGFIQEYKAERAMDALKKIVQPTTKVVREGKIRKILSREVVPGDLLVLETGDRISADAEIIELAGLRVDEAALTGESDAVEKSAEGMIFAGTQIVHGRCKARVVATGMHTKLGKIAEMIQDVEEPTPLQIKIKSLGKTLAFVALIACLIIFILGIFKGAPLAGMLIVALALAVAAIPEGLPLTLTLTLSMGMHRMAKHNAIIRKMLAVETLGSTTVICTDKTGTLTKNEMTVERIFVDDRFFDVTGVGYNPKGDFMVDDKKINLENEVNLKLLLKAATLCNNAVLQERGGEWEVIGDPTEAALVVSAAKADLWKDDLEDEYKRIEEITFTSERKLMTTLYKKGKESMVFTKGAPEILLEKCRFINKKGKVVKLNKKEAERMLETIHGLAGSAFRVLGIAYKTSPKPSDNDDFEKDLVFLGLVAMKDPPREEVKEAIETCKNAGIKVVMITGDNKETAKAIAKDIGLFDENRTIHANTEKLKKIVEDGVVTGSELEALDDDEFESIVDDIVIYARTLPEQKLRIVRALKKKGHIVAMTGDGVNDAPALKNADIGIAMGIKGTDVTKEASDMVLLDDNFATIVEAVKGGRTIYENIEKFTCYLISRNFTEVILIALGTFLLGFEFLPLLALQILFINTFDEEMPAIALGLDSARKGTMQRPPRRERSILTRRNAFLIFSMAAFMAAVAFTIFLLFHPTVGIEKARTMVFATIVSMILFLPFAFRSLDESILKVGILTNKLLVLAVMIIAVVTLVVMYVPFLQGVFELTTLGLKDWIICLPAAFSTVVFMELFKSVRRRIGNPARK
ncbi:cation-translocating P-type ATPase [Candidatus Woesearchaeota archaeon]|nr:cation-translocating P-type ATPase [Candidatus Woesearchaeota archaeon]